LEHSLMLRTIVQSAVTGVVLWGFLNALGLFALSRRRRLTPTASADLRLWFVVPALDEARVIKPTVEHLLGLDCEGVVVVDDASSDRTAGEVRALGDPRVVLVSRRLPEARLGKGAALNSAYRYLRDEAGLAGRQDVVLCVVDADGRIEPGALEEAAIRFADHQVGACQISVRIRNRRASLWTRMQHFEFVAFTALYQRGRERTGAVGLGGNGQFARLVALESLGDEPWSSCLVEDMDLGIRLLLAGWRNRYISTSHVTQQGLPDLRRLVRQRTRWFQGTLQCLRHVPAIVASPRLPLRTRMDLAGSLLTPTFLLLASPLILLGWIWLIAAVSFGGASAAMTPATLFSSYVIAFLPALLLAYAFWLDEPDATLPEAVIAGHAFVLYGYLWLLAGWKAVARQLLKRKTWAKTARLVEAAA
jgi:cellulose synthase/poly-beta-1,6-N-acetylglucosamine synthase-like glycosyltransferase